MEVGIALSDFKSPGPFKANVIGQAGRVPCEADNWWISVSNMRVLICGVPLGGNCTRNRDPNRCGISVPI